MTSTTLDWLRTAALACALLCGAGCDSGPATADDAGGVVPRADAGHAPGTDAGPGGDPDSGIPRGSAWRPFSDASPWNTPIPSDAALRPDSDALVAHLVASHDGPLFVSISPWSVPVYEVDGSTPTVSVRTPLSNEGEGLTFEWPVPAGALPAPELDGHMTIVDRVSGRGYDFYQGMPRGDGTWDCTLCSTIDLNGTGVRPPKGGSTPWYQSHGSRACGFPLIAGLIRPEEIEAGRIDHALVIAYPALRQRWFRSPASTGHPPNGLISEGEGVPCGGRFQLDPSLDVESLGLSPAGVAIARALQEYGAYVGDFAGSINLYADGSEEAREYWYGGAMDDFVVSSLDLSRLRVIEWGELTPDG